VRLIDAESLDKCNNCENCKPVNNGQYPEIILEYDKDGNCEETHYLFECVVDECHYGAGEVFITYSGD